MMFLPVLLMLFFANGVSVADTMVLDPIQDAWVSSQNTWDNHGFDPMLWIGVSYGDIMRTYVEFDLTQLPENIQIIDAYLNMTAISVITPLTCELTGKYVTSPWIEYTIVDYNAPEGGGQIFSEPWMIAVGETIEPQVTSAAQNWYADPANNHGIVIETTVEEQFAFMSREWGGDAIPHLIVNYTSFPQAWLSVSPAALTLDWISGDPAPTSTFDIQNTGNAPLNWTLTDDAAWMSCDPLGGTVAQGASQTVTVNVDMWPGEGTYNGIITVEDPNANPTQATVAVELSCVVPQPLELTLTPPADPVVVPPGGSFEYDLLLVSGLDDFTLIDIWAQAVLPNANIVSVWLVNNFPMGPNTVIPAQNLYQSIPVTAPNGDYVFTVLAGDYPGNVMAEDSFGVTVSGGVAGGANDWSAGGFRDDLAGYLSEPDQPTVATGTMPTDFAVAAAYPNPFNPSTTVSLTLPEAVDVNVTVFNVNGLLVAELANGRMAAGQHNLTLNASGLASGLYFIRATVPGHLNQTQKVMLVR